MARARHRRLKSTQIRIIQREGPQDFSCGPFCFEFRLTGVAYFRFAFFAAGLEAFALVAGFVALAAFGAFFALIAACAAARRAMGTRKGLQLT